MKILIINHFFPPMVDAHAYRWGQIAKFWAAQGHDVTVLTSRVAGSPRHQYVDGVDVQRVGLVDNQLVSGHSAATSSHRQTRVEKIIALLRKFYRFFYWPDGLWHWFPFAFSRICRLRKVDYDLIVSYSPTFSAHLAALAYMKISSGRRARWVADYGDPFSLSNTMQPNNFKLYSRLNAVSESIVLNTADQVSFTNPETCEAYNATYGGRNLVVIPHLADLNSLYTGAQRVPAQAIVSPRIIRLVYVGGFHKGIREPDLFFEVAAKLVSLLPFDLQVDVYGPSNGFDFSAMKPPTAFHGPVPRDRALKLLSEADCLVNVDNRNCVMSPSKLVEYVATGKPILNFMGDREMSGVMQAYKEAGMVMNIADGYTQGDLQDVAEFLVSRFGAVASHETVASVLAEYKLDAVAGRYSRIVDPMNGKPE